MSFMFNSKPLIGFSDNFLVDLPSNSVNQRSLFGSNPLYPSFVIDSDLNISSNHAKTLLPSFTVDPKMGSVNTTDSYHPFSEFPLFKPSELIAEYPDPYAPISSPLAYSDCQHLGNQAVLYEPNNIDMRGKHVFDILDSQPCPEITQQSSFVENQILDVSSLTNNHTSNDNDFVHRLNKESLSPLSSNHFTWQNEQNAVVAQAMTSVPHVDGADFLSLGTLKRKALEQDEEEERTKRRNKHRCNLCNMGFSTGNALGGHMSYHSKKNKLEANKRNVKAKLMSNQPLDSDVCLKYSTNPFMW